MFEEFGRNESKMDQEETVVLTKELIKAARTTNGGLTYTHSHIACSFFLTGKQQTQQKKGASQR